jgi:hypothetical protein
MECLTVKRDVSAYLDNAVSEEERRAMKQHLSACRPCSWESLRQQRTRDAVRSLPKLVPPPELAARLRSAGSLARHEPRNMKMRLDRWGVRINLFMRNLMRPLALPVVGGLCATVFLFSALVPTFSWHRTPGDVPTALAILIGAQSSEEGRDIPNVTKPMVKNLAPIGFLDGDAVVDLRIDEEGRIVNYSILGAPGKEGDQLRRSIENNLLFTTFTPATAFGKPIAGTIRISFRSSRIEVRG